MAKFSKHFKLAKNQLELDFVDVSTDRDSKLFVDPFALSLRTDEWGRSGHSLLTTYFQRVIDCIRANNESQALQLLGHLNEPNETRLGLSSGTPQGAGIGPIQAARLLLALTRSKAVKTGFLSSLEECELLVAGIGPDKISDLTTNVLRKHLAIYTKDQCELHGIPVQSVSIGAHFSLDSLDWESEYFALPVVNGAPVLLVPKDIVRRNPSYNHQQYYRGFVLEFLRAEHLAANSGLVRALKSGRRRVFNKDLEAKYPCTKEYLFEFSKKNPSVLEEYREELKKRDLFVVGKSISDDDERWLAKSLRAALTTIPSGNTHANDYHRFMVGALEFIFFPDLVHPRKEREIHDGRKRIDISTENAAVSGPFHRLHDVKKLPCNYVAIECKNYSRDIANPELDQIAGRFSVKVGKLGLIVCRKFDNKLLFIERCRDTHKDDRGLILPFDDEAIDNLLEIIESGKRREVRSYISTLVETIWVS